MNDVSRDSGGRVIRRDSVEQRTQERECNVVAAIRAGLANRWPPRGTLA